MKHFIVSILLFWTLSAGAANNDIHHFEDAKQQQRFQQLTAELRCVVCQNQSLAESHAPLAEDLRQEVASLIQQDKTDAQIITYLVDRYGQFILYKPTVSKTTWLLWFGPFILLFIGLASLIYVIAKRQQTITSKPSEQAS